MELTKIEERIKNASVDLNSVKLIKFVFWFGIVFAVLHFIQYLNHFSRSYEIGNHESIIFSLTFLIISLYTMALQKHQNLIRKLCIELEKQQQVKHD